MIANPPSAAGSLFGAFDFPRSVLLLEKIRSGGGERSYLQVKQPVLLFFDPSRPLCFIVVAPGLEDFEDILKDHLELLSYLDFRNSGDVACDLCEARARIVH